jgi:CheY-like chemotaxis protein
MMIAAARPVVLLAEDDENDVFLMKRAFKRLNSLAQLLVLTDGAAVQAYFEGDAAYADRVTWPLPNLLVLDHSMPLVSGSEVLVWLRTHEAFRSLPVVILTGGLSPDQFALVTSLRAACCPKMSDFSQMEDALNKAMCAAVQLASESWHAPSTVPKRILVVDDDAVVLELLRLSIRQAGHSVQTAASATDALEKIAAADFDLVLTDITMPAMSGEDLAREIKSRKPQLAVILISGRKHPSPSEGARGFLGKPFSLQQLKDAIATAD